MCCSEDQRSTTPQVRPSAGPHPPKKMEWQRKFKHLPPHQPGLMLNTLQGTGQPHNTELSRPNIHRAEAENPSPEVASASDIKSRGTFLSLHHSWPLSSIHTHPAPLHLEKLTSVTRFSILHSRSWLIPLFVAIKRGRSPRWGPSPSFPLTPH